MSVIVITPPFAAVSDPLTLSIWGSLSARSAVFHQVGGVVVKMT